MDPVGPGELYSNLEQHPSRTNDPDLASAARPDSEPVPVRLVRAEHALSRGHLKTDKKIGFAAESQQVQVTTIDGKTIVSTDFFEI